MENQSFFNPAGMSSNYPSMATWHHPFSSAMDAQPQAPHLTPSFPFDSALMVSSTSNNQFMGKSERRTNVAEFSPDPGFAERAARFSCLGSRSFNGRQWTNGIGHCRSRLPIANEKLNRVSSSPSLKALGSETKNSSSQEDDGSSLSISNPRKRKAVSKPKFKEIAKRRLSPYGYSVKLRSNSGRGVVEGCEKGSPKKIKEVDTKEIENGNVKTEEDSKKTDGDLAEEKQSKAANSKAPEPPKDYIHVRARRGQATDSHSLAERVRREKISERMKLLQDLVPGCNKVTGKALMLDEIINYVQSLQHQVEFLSMKLSSVNTTRVDFSMDSLISKQMYQSTTSLPHPQISPIDSSASRFYGQHQNPSLPTTSHCSVDPLDSVLCQNLPIQLPPLNSFPHNHSRYPSFGEDELQSIVQMGFVQNQIQEISLQSQNFNLGSDQMKIEL